MNTRGLIALYWRPTQSACLVHIDLRVWSYLSPNQDQFMEAEVEEKERGGGIFWLSATGCDVDLKDCVLFVFSLDPLS